MPDPRPLTITWTFELTPPPGAVDAAFAIVVFKLEGDHCQAVAVYRPEAGVSPERAYDNARRVIDQHDVQINHAPRT